MNAILERVKYICHSVRESHTNGITFKKLITAIRSKFKQEQLDLKIKTKKDQSLSNVEFYVNAYYDPEDDFNNETPIEVIIHHNFTVNDVFNTEQITDLLIQIFDATVHEYKHQRQSQARNFEVFSAHEQSPFEEYLIDPDEVDAYAFSIAIELLRYMSTNRAKMYMTRIKALAKMRNQYGLISPNLKAYMDHFGLNATTKRLSKKVYKHLDSIDKAQIFR